MVVQTVPWEVNDVNGNIWPHKSCFLLDEKQIYPGVPFANKYILFVWKYIICYKYHS